MRKTAIDRPALRRFGSSKLTVPSTSLQLLEIWPLSGLPLEPLELFKLTSVWPAWCIAWYRVRSISRAIRRACLLSHRLAITTEQVLLQQDYQAWIEYLGNSQSAYLIVRSSPALFMPSSAIQNNLGCDNCNSTIVQSGQINLLVAAFWGQTRAIFLIRATESLPVLQTAYLRASVSSPFCSTNEWIM